MSGFWDYLFDSEYKQRDDIDDAREQVSRVDDELRSITRGLQRDQRQTQQAVKRAGKALRHLRRQLDGAETRIDRIELVTEALFLHLEQHNGLTRERLRELMHEVDAADGKVDGKATSLD